MPLVFRKTLLTTSILLLIINGIGALYGSWHLIYDDTGNSLQLPLSFLKNTPFKNYFIPGIILFIVNGIGSILVITSIIVKYKYYAELIILQGMMLTGWIVTQILMLQMFYLPMHLPFIIIGMLFIITGFTLKKEN